MSCYSTEKIEKSKDGGPLMSSGSLQCKSGSRDYTFNGGKITDLNSSEQLFEQASADTFAASRFGHDFSLVPAHTDIVQQTSPLLHTGIMVQRFPENENASSTPAPEATPTPTTAEPEEEPVTPEETTAPALLVEDSATELAPGQMKKSEFLAQLRTEVTRTAEAAMAGTGRTTADCPNLNFWFDYYSLRDSTHIERAMHRYAPETRSATSSSEYISIITGRVRRAVDTWVRTGEVTGVPEGVPTSVSGAGGGGEGAAASTGSVMAKARNGGIRSADDPQAIQAELGQGRPLDGGVRSRMESAFGMDFSHVRTHTDPTASNLSNRLNARAFTVGKHVAFGSGEYKPGTILGEALIAHEMAHVVQQNAASASVAPIQTGNSSYNMLENDADTSAVGALACLWGGAKGKLADVAQNVIPRLRSGLSLQRCNLFDDDEKIPAPRQAEAPPQGAPRQQREEPRTEPEVTAPPPLTATGNNRLVPNPPTAGCIPTTGEGAARTSSASFNVQYEKIYPNRFEITLRDREDNDKVLHTAKVSESAPKIGQVTIPAGIPVQHEDNHYELEMIFYNSKGNPYGGLNPRPAVTFEVCRLEPAPTGEHLLFAKAIYAEGVDEGEFPYVRDVVYNRIDWVANCPGDAGDFGTTITTVLNAPGQFASVLNNSNKFQELESELNTRSGACVYTTAPRSGNPNKCRLVNAAIQTEAAGDGNTHEYVYFRSDRRTPSNRAVIPPWHYPGGNYYWEIRNCPPERQRGR